MSELSFLIQLLLNQKLSKPVKDLIANRIREIEARPEPSMARVKIPLTQVPPHLAAQAPSTIANLMKEQGIVPPVVPPLDAPAEPLVVAATQATAQAMESRNQAIRQGMSGKPEPGRTSPRKF